MSGATAEILLQVATVALLLIYTLKNYNRP